MFLLLAPMASSARVTPDEAAQLGGALTPIGAQAAGNERGSIPGWTPLTKGADPRTHDPFSADLPLFTVTAKNVSQYQGQLSEGHKALLKTFPESYQLPVYPTRRSAAFPTWFYEASRRNATAVDISNGGYGFDGAAQGIPFPIPKSGSEVMWNHIARYNTRGFRGFVNTAMSRQDGTYELERIYLELAYAYNNPNTTITTLNNRNLSFMSKIVLPVVKAGGGDLVRVPLDRMSSKVDAWVYVPSNGRVLRGVDNGYDTPLNDGLMTYDTVDMFNGPLDRYDVKLIGKRELIVPYNTYALHSSKLKYADLLKVGHLNPRNTRYELHRVWMVEATTKAGAEHRYQKRMFYLDEDSWGILLQDIYDESGTLWRFSEAHPIVFGDLPALINGLQVHYDLRSKRYAAVNLTNEESKLIEYDWEAKGNYFMPNSLARFISSKN
ncbi:MAG: DUF1329 domain-containing protein [Panacagrimonas sp.]